MNNKPDDKPSQDNRSRQLNPKDPTYWLSRGEPMPANPDAHSTEPQAPPANPSPPKQQTPEKK